VSVGLDEDGLRSPTRKLTSIANGELKVRVEDGRGHCEKINTIYRKHLERWFERVLNNNEQAKLAHVFHQLGHADVDVFELLVSIVEYLGDEAGPVAELAMKGRYREARKRIRGNYSHVQPIMLAMSESLVDLIGLRYEYMKIADVL
jgi:hypothetical protein